MSDEGIRWIGKPENRPPEITVYLELTKDFSELEKSDLRFKKLTAVLGISTLILGIVVAINTNKLATAKPPVSQSPTSTLPAQAVSSSTPPISQSPIPNPPATENIYQRLYDERKFPRSTCGKVVNKEVNFVVFVPLDKDNSTNIEKFCKDVNPKVKTWYPDKIQVAAFSDENDAQQLVDFITKHDFPGAWKSPQ